MGKTLHQKLLDEGFTMVSKNIILDKGRGNFLEVIREYEEKVHNGQSGGIAVIPQKLVFPESPSRTYILYSIQK